MAAKTVIGVAPQSIASRYIRIVVRITESRFPKEAIQFEGLRGMKADAGDNGNSEHCRKIGLIEFKV